MGERAQEREREREMWERERERESERESWTERIKHDSKLVVLYLFSIYTVFYFVHNITVI